MRQMFSKKQLINLIKENAGSELEVNNLEELIEKLINNPYKIFTFYDANNDKLFFVYYNSDSEYYWGYEINLYGGFLACGEIEIESNRISIPDPDIISYIGNPAISLTEFTIPEDTPLNVNYADMTTEQKAQIDNIFKYKNNLNDIRIYYELENVATNLSGNVMYTFDNTSLYLKWFYRGYECHCILNISTKQVSLYYVDNN